MAVNYFGFHQALEPFRAYCAKHGAALIEDNTHGFLSRDAQGNPLDTRGDLAIAGMGKTAAIPDGAALLINRTDVLDRLPPELACCDKPLPVGYAAKRCLARIRNSKGFRVRSFAETLAQSICLLRTGSAFPVSSPDSELAITSNAASHCESLTMLLKLDARGEVARRRMFHLRFQGEFRRLDIDRYFRRCRPVSPPTPAHSAAPGPVAAAATRIARRHGLDCSEWPELPEAVADAAPDLYRNGHWADIL